MKREVTLNNATDEELMKVIDGAKELGVNLNTLVPFDKGKEFMDIMFKCQQCGDCCTYLPTGDGIAIYEKEAYLLADKAKMRFHKFKTKYLVKSTEMEGMLNIKFPCPFLVNKRCSIYKDRPVVCWIYPVGIPEDVDGTTMLTVSSQCPACRKLVFTLLKARRDLLSKIGIKGVMELAKSLGIEVEK